MLGVGAIAAGMAYREMLKENGGSGTVKIFGCPGEESGSGKAYMARDGVFDDCDIALTWHPANFHMVCTGSSQSCIQACFRFQRIFSCSRCTTSWKKCTRCSRADGCGCKLYA